MTAFYARRWLDVIPAASCSEASSVYTDSGIAVSVDDGSGQAGFRDFERPENADSSPWGLTLDAGLALRAVCGPPLYPNVAWKTSVSPPRLIQSQLPQPRLGVIDRAMDVSRERHSPIITQ